MELFDVILLNKPEIRDIVLESLVNTGFVAENKTDDNGLIEIRIYTEKK